ncbi:hypothetical protein ISS30_05170 [bacterium]|nr:hypothetical protein [bacterium]
MKIVSRANTWVRPYIPGYMWCHASPHDTKLLFILCMVSTAESRHHNELNPKPQPLNPIFKGNTEY